MQINLLFSGLLFFAFACNKAPGNTSADVKISVDDVIVNEGNNGAVAVQIIIRVQPASSKEVRVNYSTQELTAKDSEDYIGISNQSVIFQSNETEKKVSISLLPDEIREADEMFKVVLSNPVNATLGKATAIITILNDDTRVPFTDAGYQAPATHPGYNLVWADEFNGASLDAASWTHETGDGCPNVCGWGNNELEFYTGRPQNLFFHDGKMIIEARAETYNGKNYTSSKIITRNKKIFKYGLVDIRAILPKGKGIWPAFWMLPENNVYGGWPKSGEIDIMELVGHEPNKVYSTIHYGPGPGSTQTGRSYTLSAGTFADSFHVFSLEWKADQIKWYVDGNLISTVNKADIGSAVYPFNEQFFFIFNLAVGGNWPGSPDNTTKFPQWMIVDYIRVFQ